MSTIVLVFVVLLVLEVLFWVFLFLMVHRAQLISKEAAAKVAKKFPIQKLKFPVDALSKHTDEVMGVLLRFVEKVPVVGTLKITRKIVQGFRFTQPILDFAKKRNASHIDEALIVEWASVQLIDFIFLKLRMILILGGSVLFAVLALLTLTLQVVLN